MQIPGLVAAELRAGHDHDAIGLRVKSAISRFLVEVAENLERVTSAPDFFTALDGDDTVAETDEQKAARERKHDAANAKRRAKYAAKHGD